MNQRSLLLIILATLFIITSCDDKEEIKRQNTVDAQSMAESAGLKILAIGNSFTDDATRHMPDLLCTLEEDDVFFTKVTKGGGSLQRHWDNFTTFNDEYNFSFCQNAEWKQTNIGTINSAIEFTDWDYVVLQQVSDLSGLYDTYQPYLDSLIYTVKKINPDVRIVWHMTWSYASTSTHPGFAKYDNDSRKMYESILSAADHVRNLVDTIIPSGKLINDLRGSDLNTDLELTRDGYHLDQGFPSYAVSCLWHECLITPYTNKSCK